MSPQDIDIVEADPLCADARACLTAYYAELQTRFPEGFAPQLSRDPDAASLVRPHGLFLIAMRGKTPIGCVALKGGGGAIAEVKRLWISPEARGIGLSKRMMQAVEDGARSLGFAALRLDTNRALPEALRLYRNAGWTEIERFNDDRYAHHFFEKPL
jgi:GNAT superfamily N-acetyltransferase